MTSKNTKERVLALLRIVNRPMLVRDIVTIIRTNEDPKVVRGNVNRILRELEDENRIRRVDEVFLKTGVWAQRWEAVQ